MLTRRSVILGAAAAVVVPVERGFARASQPSTPVNFEIPANACDCHAHIYGDPKQFPMSPNRVYTPDTSSPAEMTALHRALQMKRVVIVNPAPYGTDNSVTIWGMKVRGKNARGIAVIDDNTSENELDRLERSGFRGIRIDLRTLFRTDPAAARLLFEKSTRRLKRLGWNFEVQTDLKTIQGMKELFEGSIVPVVIDHFATVQAALGVDQPGFSELVDLVQRGNTYVKISAAYRSSNVGPSYSDIAPFAKALIAANPDRILWGSDWPHPAGSATSTYKRPVSEVTPHIDVDDGRILNLLPTWAPDPKIREQILVENPARLYRF
jgi:predicted TIM-barrel fold metal-dependent hydrolase